MSAVTGGPADPAEVRRLFEMMLDGMDVDGLRQLTRGLLDLGRRLPTPSRPSPDLRHAHASWLLAGGSDLRSVMDRMGHAQIQTTQKYLPVSRSVQPSGARSLLTAARGEDLRRAFVAR